MKKFISIFLILTTIFLTSLKAFAEMNSILDDTASYIYKTVSNPQVGSVGGEWAVLGLARSGIEFPREYYENYYKNVEEYVKASKGNIHDRKYTEYSRLILALTSIGKNPADVAGFNLLTPLGDYEKTIWQGVNGAIWALIALDSGGYDMPINPNANVQATREMYIERILNCQLSDGGWCLSSRGEQVPDPDITGMALQALSKYRDNIKVNNAIENALLCMSKIQDDEGGFSSFGDKNCESTVQMIAALCELGISIEDERFVKNGKTLFDSLERFYIKGSGFSHMVDGETNQMSTEQALYALVAIKRASEGRSTLYNMKESAMEKTSIASVSVKALYMLEQFLMEINK